MKIAFVHTTPADETALARRMRRAARELARDHEITVFCIPWWDGANEKREHRGVTYCAVSDSPRRFVTRLPSVIRGWRPDVVHVAGANPKAALAAQLSGTPVLVDWYGENTSQLLDRAFSGADRVIVPSEHVRTKVRERGSAATVVPEGVCLAAIRETEPSGSAALVWSGSLDEYANLDGLLLALAEFRDREWRTTVIGEGPYRMEYERLTTDLRIDSRVEFVGELPRAERVGRMKGAHVFVQTADRTPFGTELLCALACGCVGIVESQPHSAANELIAGYKRGIGVTSDEEIVGAIERAAEYPHETYSGRFERFSCERVTGLYLSQYRACGTAVQ